MKEKNCRPRSSTQPRHPISHVQETWKYAWIQPWTCRTLFTLSIMGKKKKSSPWKVTSQGDLIINSYLGRSRWAVTAHAHNFFSKRLIFPLRKPCLWLLCIEVSKSLKCLLSDPTFWSMRLHSLNVNCFLPPSCNLLCVPSLIQMHKRNYKTAILWGLWDLAPLHVPPVWLR